MTHCLIADLTRIISYSRIAFDEMKGAKRDQFWNFPQAIAVSVTTTFKHSQKSLVFLFKEILEYPTVGSTIGYNDGSLRCAICVQEKLLASFPLENRPRVNLAADASTASERYPE